MRLNSSWFDTLEHACSATDQYKIYGGIVGVGDDREGGHQICFTVCYEGDRPYLVFRTWGRVMDDRTMDQLELQHRQLEDVNLLVQIL